MRGRTDRCSGFPNRLFDVAQQQVAEGCGGQWIPPARFGVGRHESTSFRGEAHCLRALRDFCIAPLWLSYFIEKVAMIVYNYAILCHIMLLLVSFENVGNRRSHLATTCFKVHVDPLPGHRFSAWQCLDAEWIVQCMGVVKEHGGTALFCCVYHGLPDQLVPARTTTVTWPRHTLANFHYRIMVREYQIVLFLQTPRLTWAP